MSPLALYIPMVLFFGWAGIDTQTLSPQPSAITGISLNFTSVGDSNVVDLRRVAEQPAHDVCFAAPSCACVLGLSLAAARDTNYPKRHPYDNVRRPRVMGDIALALSLGGDAEGSRKTFEEALKAVSQIEKPSDRISALLDLPRKLAKAGDVNGALDVTSQIDDPRSRGEALLGISEEQAMLGDLVGAKTTIAVALGAADQIEHALSRSVFLSNVARSKAVGGDINGAFATADRIGDDEWRASAYVYSGDSGDTIPI